MIMAPSSAQLMDLVEASLGRRAALLTEPEPSACRLMHDRADGIDGLVIEKLADVLIIQRHEGRCELSERQLRDVAEHVRARVGARAVYFKDFVRDRAELDRAADARHRDARPWLGEPVEPVLTVAEADLRLLVRPYDGFSVGLFLEHRANRQRVRLMAAGRRVLNTFSYTGGFSVAAARGGAISVASVDVSRRYLSWSRENFAANTIELEPHRFYCSDIFDFYHRARRSGLRYDLIILDPPSFARLRRPKRTFELAKQLERLVAEGVELLDPGGIVLLAVNHRGIARDRLVGALEGAGGSLRCRLLEMPEPPPDFAGDSDYCKTIIAQFE
jgi:23S rRNA (cytosine1962-C5)-methyltransferase